MSFNNNNKSVSVDTRCNHLSCQLFIVALFVYQLLIDALGRWPVSLSVLIIVNSIVS